MIIIPHHLPLQRCIWTESVYSFRGFEELWVKSDEARYFPALVNSPEAVYESVNTERTIFTEWIIMHKKVQVCDIQVSVSETHWVSDWMDFIHMHPLFLFLLLSSVIHSWFISSEVKDPATRLTNHKAARNYTSDRSFITPTIIFSPTACFFFSDSVTQL